MEHLWTGRVTQVIDPHCFWMQLGFRGENLYIFEQLQQELQRFCGQEWTSVQNKEELERSQVVLVDTGDVADRARYQRGQIARICDNSVDVFYVDFGNTQLTTMDRVCVKFPPQFKTCPPQAVRCTLAGVKPVSKNWTNRGTKTFQNAVKDQMMYTLVLYGSAGFCEVALYPSNEDHGRSIAHLLLDEEVALPTGEIPETVREIQDFMARMTAQSSNTDGPAAYTNAEVSQEMTAPPQTPEVSELRENHSPSLVQPQPFSHSTKTAQSSKPVDRYAPPKRRKPWETTSESNLSTSPGSDRGSLTTDVPLSSQQRSGKAALALNTSLKVKEQPVVDFFPFENVSTYPASPVSPLKSPTKSPLSAPPGFNRAPAKHQSSPKYHYQESSFQDYKSQNHNSCLTDSGNQGRSPRAFKQGESHGNGRGSEMRGSGRGHALGNNRISADQTSYKNDYSHHRGGGDHLQTRGEHHERHRFAAKFNNLPDVEKHTPTVISGREASAALEPSFLQSTLEKAGGGSPQSSDPSLTSYPVRFTDRGKYAEPSQRKSNDYISNQSPRQDYNSRRPPFYSSRQNEASDGNQVLRSPDYFQHYHPSHQPYSQTSRSQQDYNSSQHSNHQQQHFHDKSSYENGYNSYSPTSNHLNNGFSNSNYKHNSHAMNTSNQPVNKPHPRLDVNKTPGKYQGSAHEECHKGSPISPESPQIAAFDINHLEHTQHLSTDDFHKHFHQEKLQKLQVEQAEIVKEAKEQFQLAKMARYCGEEEEEADDSNHLPMTDLEPVSENSFNIFINKGSDYEQSKRSPNRTRVVESYGPGLDMDVPPKLSGIPPPYLVDIDFCEVIEDALDFGKSEGLEKAKHLLDEIMESMRTVPIERQLYDIVGLLVARAVEDFNLTHTLVLDTLSTLNAEVDIKECLARALKRQQEISVQYPAKGTFHKDFAHVMGLIYNMAVNWNDSNSSVQDCILGTLEKWIVFNNKGSQIGQSEKENVFLDCFGAFWEVSGKLLQKANPEFTARIKVDIRKKVLHEQVARSIRERLLDVLQELSSPNVETQHASTQTIRRTTIPSSCQVKPITTDKYCQTRLDWSDLEEMYQNDDMSLDDPWISATEKLDLDVSLRPQGHPSAVNQSTPVEAGRDRHTDRTGKAALTSFRGTTASSNINSVADVSDLNVTDNASVYATPDESRMNESDLVSDSVAERLQSSVMEIEDSIKSNGEQGGFVCNASSHETKQHSALHKEIAKQSVDKTKSAFGTGDDREKHAKRSVVDWFEYVPDKDSEINKTDKLQEKRLEARIHLETIVDMAEKFTDNKESKSKNKKNKKSKKVAYSEESKPETLLSAKSPSVDPVQKKDSTAAPVVSAAVNVNKDSDKPVDWWGVGGDIDLRPPLHTMVSSCDTFIIPGEDVIIEEEVEQVGDNTSANSEDFIDDQEVIVTDTETEQRDEGKPECSQDQEVVDVVKAAVKGEEFASDREDTLDDWESNDSDNVDTDSIALGDPYQLNSKSSPSLSPQSTADKSSKTNKEASMKLTDYLQIESETNPQPQQPRWVPGRRLCLNCKDPSHTSDCCPKGVRLLN